MRFRIPGRSTAAPPRSLAVSTGTELELEIQTADQFLELVQRNTVNRAILERMTALNVPDMWLVSGCLFQTVWNCLDGREPARGINDYDVFYYDEQDRSHASEVGLNEVASSLFSDLECVIDVRNQARVHEWYADEFGVEGYPTLESATDGIDHFLSVNCMVAVRRDEHGEYEIYAPFGLDDVFERVVRPNPWFPEAPRDRYYQKADRWKALWPAIRILPFEVESLPSP